MSHTKAQRKAIAHKAYLKRQKRRQEELVDLLEDDFTKMLLGRDYKQVHAQAAQQSALVLEVKNDFGHNVAELLLGKLVTK